MPSGSIYEVITLVGLNHLLYFPCYTFARDWYDFFSDTESSVHNIWYFQYKRFTTNSIEILKSRQVIFNTTMCKKRMI